MKRLICLWLFICNVNVAYSYQIPTVAVANLFYKKQISSPVIYKSINDESGNIKTVVNDSTNQTDIIRSIGMFNSSIRGKIAMTQNFKVIDNQRITNLWHGDVEPIVEYINNMRSNESSVKRSYINLPDYILLGEITSYNNSTDIEQIQNTDKQTIQFNLDIMASYNLISTKDGAVMASFDVTGHGNDTKIMSQGSSLLPKQNKTILLKYASDDLSTNVVNAIIDQFNITAKTYKTESIENIKIYN